MSKQSKSIDTGPLSLNRRDLMKAGAAGAAAAAISRFTIVPARAKGANERINVGCIGVGSRGSGHVNDVNKIGKTLNAQVVAVCDTWTSVREAVAERVRSQVESEECLEFSNYEDLLARKDIDAVVIATPDFAHTPILIDALKAGKDVYVEKPMSVTLAEANEAVDVARQAKQVIQVGTQRRSDGKWISAGNMIRSGILGKISRVEIMWNDNGPRWNKGQFELKEADVDWKRFLMGKKMRKFDPHQYREWQLYRDYTYGPIALLGVHFLDVVAWYMDDPYPETAVALGGNYVIEDHREHEDTVTALWTYPKGFLCEYTTGLGNSVGAGCKVFGTNGMFDDSTWKFTGDGGAGDGKIKEAVTVQPAPTPTHMVNWLECIRSRQLTHSPIETGHQHTVAGLLGYQALLKGRKQRYLPDKRRIVDA